MLYYDQPEYWDFWSVCQDLDVPFYLHPREPPVCRTLFLEGYPWLRTSSWAFTLDMATHMLRLTLPSATLLMLGVEVIFGSFFLSLLGLNRR